MITETKLRKLVSSRPKKEKVIIMRSYRFAKNAHKGQNLSKNSPFILHPTFVGYLLASWKQNVEMICAGILHDTIEDAEVSIYTLSRLFGEKVAFYVDGMSWFKKWDVKNGRYSRDREGYFDKFCKFVLIDEKLILIKAADEMSKVSKDPLKTKFRDSVSEGLAKKFWISFFTEVGLKKVSNHLINKLNSPNKEKVVLYNYLSKSSLKKLRSKLNKIKGIEGLK